MKTLEDLKRLRAEVQSRTSLRQEAETQIIVGMGTCGIAAGAREIMSAILQEIAERKLEGIAVRQTGCIGMCEKEVLVDVVFQGQPRVTYGNVTPAAVKEIITEHVQNGRIVEKYVFGKID